MGWGEAVRLTTMLARDPSSRVAGAVMEWEAPRSPEWLLLADLYDAFGVANFKSHKRYPRPFLDPGERRVGKTALTRAEVIAVMRDHGHHIGEEAEPHG